MASHYTLQYVWYTQFPLPWKKKQRLKYVSHKKTQTWLLLSYCPQISRDPSHQAINWQNIAASRSGVTCCSTLCFTRDSFCCSRHFVNIFNYIWLTFHYDILGFHSSDSIYVVFCAMTPYSLVGGNRRFRETYYLYLQSTTAVTAYKTT
jgi:hypothetical protein